MKAVVLGVPLVTINEGEENERQVIDLGNLRQYVQNAGNGYWVISKSPYHGAFKDLGQLQDFRVFIGVATAGTIEQLKARIGAKAKTVQEAIQNGAVRNFLINAGIRRLRRKSTGDFEGFVPLHTLSGLDHFSSSVPDGEDPNDFEEEDLP